MPRAGASTSSCTSTAGSPCTAIWECEGRWDVYAAGERWRRPAHQAWIALSGGEAEAVNFCGSTMRIAREAQLRRDPRLARLGPDLLADDFEPAWGAQALRRVNPDTEVGEALLDQGVIAGIGNIFKSEGCFEVRIAPLRPVGSVTDAELVQLVAGTQRLMLDAVETGRQPNRVYRKAGRPCPRCSAGSFPRRKATRPGPRTGAPAVSRA